MQAGTAPSGTVETVPDFRISLDGSSWPPASGELPAGTGSVVDFSIQRDLTGGGLPGAARGGSGFSVASGSVTLPMGRAELTPWAAASKRVSPGGLAWFRAHPTTLTSITLGRFIVDECSAGSFGGLSLNLVESQRQMDGPFTYPWQYDATNPQTDAAEVMAKAAQASGYSTLVTATGRPSLQVELIGSDRYTTTGGWEKESSLNPIWASGPAGAMLTQGRISFSASQDGLPLQMPILAVTATIIGDGADFRFSRTGFQVSSESFNTGVAVMLPPGDSNVRHVAITREPSGLRLTDLVTRLSVLAAPGGQSVLDGSEFSFAPISGSKTSGVAGVSLWGAISDSSRFQPPSARIDLTGSQLKGVFDVAGKSAREVFQAVVAATMGAGWQSETGDLIYRNAASLRTGKPVEAVAIRDKVEDLRWSISRDNSADRVTVTYTPADVQQDPAHKITLWEATEPIMVPGNRTVTVTAEITGTTDRISPFSIVTTNAADAANATYSRWHASSSREGGGTRPADDAIRIETKITGPSTVKLTITNTTNGTLWLVDGNGNPLVILRTSLQVQPGEPQVLEWGQPEDKALNPFPFDCGQWVQDQATAQAMLAWLVDQLRSPLPTITQVRVIPDLRRQLGDIVTLTDEDSGLKAKALIIGISLEGDAGGYTQRLTLAILSVTYSDVKRWAKAQGINTYGQLKAHLVANGATTYKLAREYLARVGVDA